MTYLAAKRTEGIVAGLALLGGVGWFLYDGADPTQPSRKMVMLAMTPVVIAGVWFVVSRAKRRAPTWRMGVPLELPSEPSGRLTIAPVGYGRAGRNRSGRAGQLQLT